MIDPTQPLELDDGTPVTLNYVGSSFINVSIPKSYMRDGSEGVRGGNWNYYLHNGGWVGGDIREYFTLRNADLAPDETEGYFV